MTAPTEPGWYWVKLSERGGWIMREVVRNSGPNSPLEVMASGWSDNYTLERYVWGPRIYAPDESPAAEPPTDDVRTLLRVTVRQLEAAEERIVELRGQLATMERERDAWRPTDNELERFFDPREKCRCGSGAHPRQCKRHKTAFAEHVNALNLGMLTGFDGLDEMEACDAAEKAIHELGVARVNVEAENTRLRAALRKIAGEHTCDSRPDYEVAQEALKDQCDT